MHQSEEIERFTDEELRVELKRRIDLILVSSSQSINDPAYLFELPPAAWEKENNRVENGSVASVVAGDSFKEVAGVCRVRHRPVGGKVARRFRP
jgi:hypothetical protein